MYTPTKVSVSQDQHEKLKRAIHGGKSVSIRINLNQHGDHTLLVTQSQMDKMNRMKMIGKPKVSLVLSKKQVKANVQYTGGFLGMLAGLAMKALPFLAKALPTLAKGLATGLVSGAVEKAISGNGLYLHKSGHCVKVEPVKGNGLYLRKHAPLHGVHGNGLYLKRGSQIYDGKGLLLGSKSPFKNIPILGLLL